MTELSIEAYRHPPIANPHQLCYGRHDIPLQQDWQQRLTQGGLTPIVPSKANPLVYVSPAERTRVFADWLFPSGIRCLEPRLQEMDFGTWEGRSWGDISHEEVCHWERDLWRHSAPGGESAAQMAERIDDFLASLRSLDRKPTSVSIVCITHHGVLKLLIAKALKLAIADTLALSIPFGGKLSFRLQGNQLELEGQLPKPQHS